VLSFNTLQLSLFSYCYCRGIELICLLIFPNYRDRYFPK
jgi:hypothetical protein